MRQSSVSAFDGKSLPANVDEAAFVNQVETPGAGASRKKYETQTTYAPDYEKNLVPGKQKTGGASSPVAGASSDVVGLAEKRDVAQPSPLKPNLVIRDELFKAHGNENYFQMEPSRVQSSAAYKHLVAEQPLGDAESSEKRLTSSRLAENIVDTSKKVVGIAVQSAKALLGHNEHAKKRKKGMHSSPSALASEQDEEIIVNDRDVQRHDGRRDFGFVMTPEKKLQLANFVKTNINCLECTTYIKDVRKSVPETGSPMAPCSCGETYEWHRQRECQSHQGPDPVEWNTAEHTREIKSTAFGQIAFVGFPGGDRRYLAPYVRVSVTTPPSKVWELVSKHWELPAPKLLLSITGGAKKFFTKNREIQIFKREFIEAVKATGAWVLTGGLGAGVMQYVGQAVHEYAATVGSMERHKLALLGVCPWSGIDNRYALVEEDEGRGLFPARYDASLLHNRSGTAALDNNHTHFIFVDDGTLDRFGGEIEWRASFERYISMHIKTGIDKEQSIHVPVVQLLINGGPNSIETAAEAIENGTPVIIVDGTKRAAELLATAYKMSQNVKWGDKRAVDSLAEKLLPIMRRTVNSENKSNLDQVLKIMEQRDLVTIFTLDSLKGEQTLARVILQALMKANKADPKSQLSLSLAWNKPDFARTEILTSEANYRALSGDKLYDPLFRSLINDQHQFVQLFLDCGVDLHKFITPTRMKNLYKEVLNKKDQDSLSELIQVLVDREYAPNEKKDSVPLLEMIGRVIIMLVGSYYPNDYKNLTYGTSAEDLQRPQGNSSAIVDMTPARSRPLLSTNKTNRNRKHAEIALKNPEKHLLIWALLFNRFDLALIFWKAGVSHMSMALIAARISGKLSRIADGEDMDDLIDNFQRMAETFGRYACEILNDCYERNKQLTTVCLTRRVRELGNATALSIADDAEHEDFMQHLSCQLKLSRVWKGNMVVYTSEWKLVLTALMPFAFVPLLYYVRQSSAHPRVDEREFDDLAQMQPVDSAAFVPGIGSRKAKRTAAPPPSGTSEFVESAPPPDELLDKQHGKYFAVGLTGSGQYKIKYSTALWYFLTAPVTKFIYHVFSYMAFLVIFSIFVLTELAPVESASEIKVFEILTWIWCISFIMEEIRQVASRSGASVEYKLEMWWNDTWNKMDLVMYSLFLVSVILRFHLSANSFAYVRMAYVVSLSFFIIRCTQMFFVYKQIGPKIIMIQRMLRDLFFFLFILGVFLFCFGISYRALLYPNAELNGALLANIVFHPYFIIFGQSPMDEIVFGIVSGSGNVSGCSTGISSSIFGYDDACPTNNWLAPTYLALYSLIVNILLINLLIAMFSFTFQSVQEHSERLWKYNRYSLIYEFFDRPALPSPFIVFTHAYRAFEALRAYCKSGGEHVDRFNDFQITLSKEESQRVLSFERVAMESYMTKLSREEKDNIDTKVQTTSQRIEKVLEDIDDIKENLSHVLGQSDAGKDDLDSQVAGRTKAAHEEDGFGAREQIGRQSAAQLSSGPPEDGAAGTGGLSRMQEEVTSLGRRLQAVENVVQQQFAALSAQMTQQTDLVVKLASRFDAGAAAGAQLARATAPGASGVKLTPVDAGSLSAS